MSISLPFFQRLIARSVTRPGLMITGLAKAYRALGDQQCYEKATRAAQFLRSNLYRSDSGQLMRSFRVGMTADQEGSADDYAFLIQGLLDLYQCELDDEWLQWAVELQKRQDEVFWDATNGGYFSAKADKTILVRAKDGRSCVCCNA